MQKIFLIHILLFFVFINGSKAQKEELNNSTIKHLAVAKPGTFQFIFHPGARKIKYHFTTETLIEIERNRDSKIEKYIWLTPSVQVRILPKEYIASENFIPIAEEKYLDQ